MRIDRACSAVNRYYPFSRFLRQKFGAPVHKVCIDAGFTCPNIDGSISVGGCTYCDNASFSPVRRSDPHDIASQIERGIAYLKRRYRAEHFLAYFQSFSNTYAPLRKLREMYSLALGYPGMIGLDVSTRPDCIDEQKLDYLQDLARQRFVLLEYGLQSSHDDTLRRINRGHDYACFVKALELTAKRGIHTCAHVILGLPGESDHQILQTADRLAALPLDFVKFHDLHLVRGTVLGHNYQQSPFHIRGREEYIDLLIRFLEHLPPTMAIMRLSSQTPSELLVAPARDADPNRLIRDIRTEMERKNTWQGRLYAALASRDSSDSAAVAGQESSVIANPGKKAAEQ